MFHYVLTLSEILHFTINQNCANPDVRVLLRDSTLFQFQSHLHTLVQTGNFCKWVQWVESEET